MTHKLRSTASQPFHKEKPTAGVEREKNKKKDSTEKRSRKTRRDNKRNLRGGHLPKTKLYFVSGYVRAQSNLYASDDDKLAHEEEEEEEDVCLARTTSVRS